MMQLRTNVRELVQHIGTIDFNFRFLFFCLLSVDVRYFAYNGQSNSVKKNNVFDFHGMDSFLQYKKTMVRSFV